MSEAKHTEGLWRHDGMGHVLVGGHTIIATISPFDVGADQAAANTLLIAAAPDMLAALQLITGAYAQHNGDTPIVAQARAAIAKAEPRP